MITIIAKNNSIIDEDVNAIVNPTNSFGLMIGGVGKILKNVGGVMIEADAVRRSPIKMGTAIVTDAGMLSARYIIHAPTMLHPQSAAKADDIKNAVIAALNAADKLECKKIAMPGMGTGVGSFEPIDAAQIIVDEIRHFKPIHLKEVILADISEIMYDAFKIALDDED